MKTALAIFLLCILPFLGLNAATIDDFNRASASCDEEIKSEHCRKTCIAEKMGLGDKDGNLIIAKFPQHIRSLLTNCSRDFEDKDSCEKIDNMKNCVASKGKAYIIGLIQQCASETGSAISLLTILTAYPAAFKDDKKACFHRCLGVTINLIDDNGNFNLDDYDQVLKENDVDFKKIKDDCIEKHNEEDVCIKSTKRLICVGESLQKFGSKFESLKNML